jgi:hypothetical protein
MEALLYSHDFLVLTNDVFLASQDNCSESYCCDPSVEVGVGVVP